jgi:photosystem II stability/assembly factor-like uncharacterized protein
VPRFAARAVVGIVSAIVLIGLGGAQPDGALAQEAGESVHSSHLGSMRYRMVGPYRGGRSTAYTGVPDRPHTFYMGTTGGGVWRTVDAGTTWQNLTDGQIEAGGIGAVAVAPSDPNVIYAGTGSACIRGNVSPGIGAYRSTDEGKTWSFIGLPEAGQIGRIVVHPDDPDTVWVAALGNAFGPNEERGVFKSTDGGASWRKVLYLDERTGVVDLSMHPTNPRILYAGAWGGERKPWTLLSGSRLGGIYRSTDGGESWDKLENGLPGGMVGKTAVQVSPANPDRVYALFEHERGGLYRSDDGGGSWRLINDDHSLWERPWYYMHITPDPQNENVVWISNVLLQKSVDGGQSFRPIAQVHPDNHGIWINPDDSNIVLNVNDGGGTVSLTGGKTWSTLRNQPTAELYRVAVDEQTPYRLYGSQQDNTTISVPSRLPSGMVSDFEDEFQFGGCESGHMAVDPNDPNIVYAGCYGGTITRYDRRTGQSRDVIAWPQLQLAQAREDLRYRFQWNAPIRISPHDSSILYHTAQKVLRSDNEGQSWTEISPDLSTNDPEHQGYAGGPITRDGTGVEIYGTVFALEESPLAAGMLWAGSDDGRLHVSRDAGGSWTEITPPDLPAGATINSIDLSRTREGRALIAAFRYREADQQPYVFATDDFGTTWRRLTDGTNGIPDHHFVRVVREDPARPGLLYAGTEFGMYVSFNDGESWQSFRLNMPATPITDLQVHRNDLVVSTQGRSFWILDDLTPLHGLTADVLAADATLLPPRDTYRMNSGGFSINDGFRAEDAPAGVYLAYTLGRSLEGAITLEVLDAAGAVVQTFSSEEQPLPPIPESFLVLAEIFGFSLGQPRLSTEMGTHRVLWNLRGAPPVLPPGAVIFGFPAGGMVPPGTYTARLTIGESVQEAAFSIAADPRGTATQEEMRRQYEFLNQVAGKIGEIGQKIIALRSVRSQVQAVSAQVAESAADEATRTGVADAAEAIVARLTELENELVQTKSRSFEDPLNYPGKLTALLANVHASANSGADAPPTDGAVELFAQLSLQADGIFGHIDTVISDDVQAFNELVAGIDRPAVVISR